MNNINFKSKVKMQAIQLIDYLIELYFFVDQLDDKVLLQKIKSENLYDLLELNNHTQTQQNSNQDLFDTSKQMEVSEKMDEEDDKQQNRIQTKRNNYILKDKDYLYECGQCQSLFKSPCALGGHIQKHHKTKTTIYSIEASLYSAQSEEN